MIRQLDLATALPTGMLLLLLLLGPLPFGSVLPFERAVVQIVAFATLALAMFRADADLRPVRMPTLALLGVATIGWLQSWSWPRAVAAWLWPAGLGEWDRAAAMLGDAQPTWVPLSLAPQVSRATAIHWAAVAAVLLAAVAVGRDRRARRLLALGIVFGAVFQIVYGADRWYQKLDTIWGVEVPGDVDRLRGTFVNPDHLALYLAITLTLTFAWMWRSLRRLREADLQLERLLLLVVPPCLLFLMLFIGLSFTGSRAGLAAAVVALLVQAAILAHHYRTWRLFGLALGGLGLGFAGILTFGAQAGLGRWLETSAFDLAWSARLVVYRTSLALWWDFPLLGTGLGTFRQALPLVQGDDLEGTWLHAHSDYLEMVVTTGVLGLPLIALGVVALVRRLLVVFRTGRRSEDRAAGLGALGAVTAVGLISAVDFGLTMPANAITLAAVGGLAAGASCGRRVRVVRQEQSRPKEKRKPPSKARPWERYVRSMRGR